MNKIPQRQSGAIDEGIIILVALSLILFVFILPKKGVPGPDKVISTFNDDSGSAWQENGNSNDQTISSDSKYEGNISLGSGNASYEIQPYFEYITLYNQSDKSVEISGLILKNAKDARVYRVGSEIKRFASDTAIIPKGAHYISPFGNNSLEIIKLKPRENAIITTGSIGVVNPYKIDSFKENKCSGYLESSTDYDFTPDLRQNCPLPKAEIGFNDLDRGCQDFLNSFSTCHIPTYGGLDSEHNRCNGCIDGKTNLSNACTAFIKSHFDYGSCIVNHKNDPDFEGETWRIFLGKGWEMWDRDQEVISLWNKAGREINSLSY